MFKILIRFILLYLSRLTTKPVKWHVRPAKTQIKLGIRPVWSESSLSTWGKLRSLAIIRAHSEASDQTLGGCPGWSESSLGPKVILLVLSWVDSFYFVSLASTILISVISRRFISWNSPRKRGFLCIHARVCLSPFIMSHCRRVVIPLSFTTVDASHCSYSLLVGPIGDVRVISLMVNGYADIYKDNRRKYLRTHTLSDRRSIITTGLKLFRISLLSTEPALSTVAVKPKITAFKTPSNNGKCYYWYCISCWLTWQLYLAIHIVSSKYI